MSFVVFGNDLALTVKDKGGIENSAVLLVGDTAGNDIDIQLLGKSGKGLFYPFAVLFAVVTEILFRVISR